MVGEMSLQDLDNHFDGRFSTYEESRIFLNQMKFDKDIG